MSTVHHPSHYTAHPSGVECIAIVENLTFCWGNAIKYLWRAGHKGAHVEDLKKALWYVERAEQVTPHFCGWALPDDVNDRVVRTVKRVLAVEPDPSLLRTALYVLIPELDRAAPQPPPPGMDYQPLIRALRTAIGGM